MKGVQTTQAKSQDGIFSCSRFSGNFPLCLRITRFNQLYLPSTIFHRFQAKIINPAVPTTIKNIDRIGLKSKRIMPIISLIMKTENNLFQVLSSIFSLLFCVVRNTKAYSSEKFISLKTHDQKTFLLKVWIHEEKPQGYLEPISILIASYRRPRPRRVRTHTEKRKPF